MSRRNVNIVGTGSYLPGMPVTNDKLEEVLGPLTHAPPKIRSFVENLGPRMMERGGIKARHFAIDPETGNMTHTFSSMAEEAARRALEMAAITPQDIDLLVMSCPSYDQSTPPTSALLQEHLGITECAEIEVHSNCSGVGKSVQIAFDAIRAGRYDTALVCYTQLSSVYLRSCYFNQARMDKVHAALRWILADGSGALVLKASDNGEPGHRILDTYVESVGSGRPAGMKAGGAAADLMNLDRQIPELYRDGNHHLWQDFTAVNDYAAPLLLDGICRFIDRLGIESSSVDHYCVSIPTSKLYEDHIPRFLERLGIQEHQIRFRSETIGYVGGAATLVQIDRMVREGELLPGQTVVVHAVESSKWMTAGFAVKW